MKGRVEHVVLLLDHAEIVPGDHEPGLSAGERLFQTRSVGQFRDRSLVSAQCLSRFVRTAAAERPLSVQVRTFASARGNGRHAHWTFET